MNDNEKRFDPQKRHGLLSEKRQARWNPPQFLQRFAVQPGHAVLDLGCGPGFWTLPLAGIVGPTGTVWALDVSQEMLDALTEQQPPAHVIPVLGELPQIGLATAVLVLRTAALLKAPAEKAPAFALFHFSNLYLALVLVVVLLASLWR